MKKPNGERSNGVAVKSRNAAGSHKPRAWVSNFGTWAYPYTSKESNGCLRSPSATRLSGLVVPDSTVLRPCLATGLPFFGAITLKELSPPHEGERAYYTGLTDVCQDLTELGHFDGGAGRSCRDLRE